MTSPTNTGILWWKRACWNRITHGSLATRKTPPLPLPPTAPMTGQYHPGNIHHHTTTDHWLRQRQVGWFNKLCHGLQSTRQELCNSLLACIKLFGAMKSLQWRHNGRDSLKSPALRLFTQSFIQKTSKLRVTGLCVSGTGEFPARMASYAENVSIWWRHHAIVTFLPRCEGTNPLMGQ